jgi:DNA gyrase subunit A
MIINKSGITIRLRVDELRVVGRATQGVKLINLRGKDEIAAICSVLKDEDDDTPTAEVVNEDMPTDGTDESEDTTENDEPSGEE